jgi:hypothetical protein
VSIRVLSLATGRGQGCARAATAGGAAGRGQERRPSAGARAGESCGWQGQRAYTERRTAGGGATGGGETK